MRDLLDVLRTRLIPASLTAAGVALVTAGLLSYTTPVAAPDDLGTPTVITEASPSPAASSRPSGSIAPSASPTAAPTFPRGRVATRIAIPGLKIDLPVIKPPGDSNTYPLCNVAMYLQAPLGQPGQGKATYLYAHAREGMFLPLLEASKVNNGQSMLGMLVYVYTSDDQLFVYEIYQVRRHQLDLNRALRAKTEQLWLQTSEGPRGTPQKLQVVARPVTNGPVNHAQAHPKAHPVVCG